MKKTLTSLLLGALIALTGPLLTSVAQAASMSAEQAIAAAREAQKQANAVGGEWRDTDKMIKQAEKLLKEGKAEEARKLAEAAEAQGMLGYMQASSQSLDKLHVK